ncbi:MAG: DsbA family protein [Aggregatilineales bacterium]
MKELRQNPISFVIILLIFIQVVLSLVMVQRLQVVEIEVLNNPGQIQVSSEQGAAFIPDIAVNPNAPTLGTQGSPVTMIEFADYECPFCGQGESTIKGILNDYKGKILFVYTDLLLSQIHPDAFKSAEAARCAGEQGKYWEMHDILFQNQGQLDVNSLKKYAASLGLNTTQFNACLDTDKYAGAIQSDMSDAQKYQVSSTPTFFVNGNRVVGASAGLLRKAIDSALTKGGA